MGKGLTKHRGFAAGSVLDRRARGASASRAAGRNFGRRAVSMRGRWHRPQRSAEARIMKAQEEMQAGLRQTHWPIKLTGGRDHCGLRGEC